MKKAKTVEVTVKVKVSPDVLLNQQEVAKLIDELITVGYADAMVTTLYGEVDGLRGDLIKKLVIGKAFIKRVK